jgi:type VI secretion system protein ImpK
VESDILVPPPVPGAKTLATELGEFLAPEVAEHLVELAEDDTAVTVRILGDGLFASGRETLTPKHLPLIQRISKALAEHDKRIAGDVRVVGHTDNVPLKRSLRFQNNIELSIARAKTVAAILRENPGITRPVVEEGKGDTEPLVPNDTAQNRAKNRRVDILVEK